MIKKIVLLCALVGIFKCDAYEWGACSDNIKPMTNFSIERYLGTWNELIQKVDNELPQADCQFSNFSISDSNRTYNLLQRRKDKNLGLTVNSYGNFTMANKTVGELTITTAGNLQTRLMILQTDYNNTAYIDECRNGLWGMFHYRKTSVVSRNRFACDADIYNKSIEVFKAAGIIIKPETFKMNDLSSCITWS